MKTMTAKCDGLSLAMLALSLVVVMPSASAATTEPAGDVEQRRLLITFLETYQERLDAFQAERLKFRAGKSTLYQVHSLARRVRDAELKMSKTPEQEIAALARYRTCARDFEEGAMSRIDRDALRLWRKEADFDLNPIKRGPQ